MEYRRTTQLALSFLLAASVLLPGASAQASKQALVDIKFKNDLFAAGYEFTVRTAMAASVTVATPGPTPSVMWPANVISGAQSITYTGYYTPFASLMETFMLKAGTIAKSHAGAAPPGGSTLVPVGSPTTLCFATNPPTVTPGPPALPNQCFPRVGTAKRAPGGKKYGGTVRMLRNSNSVGTFVGYPTGNDNFSIRFFYTSRLTGPSAVGDYGVRVSGSAMNTVLLTTRETQGIETNAPFTTGMVTVMGGNYATQITLTGSRNIPTANQICPNDPNCGQPGYAYTPVGSISVVKPVLFNAFNRPPGGGTAAVAIPGIHGVRSFKLTFLPEPGATLLLGCGILGLAGIAALRRR